MNYLISIIVSTYNCGKYINRLINSVLKQSYKNFELIIIDDGSTDNTEEVISLIKDERIKVIRKENSGVSDSRNRGLQEAKGKLICFLDADDYIDDGLFEEIIKKYKTYPMLELLNFGMYFDIDNENLEQISSNLINYKEKYYETREEIKEDFVNLWDNTMLYNIVNKVYLKEIIDKYNLKFPSFNWGEDIEFNRNYLDKINNFYNSSKAYYHYVRDRKGAVTVVFNPNLFEIRKQEFNEFNKYFEKWEIKKEDYYEFSCRRYLERVLGVIENLYCSNLTLKKRYSKIKYIINDDTTRETLKYIKPKSKKIKIMLIPIRMKNTILTMLMGRLFHIVKNSFPKLFHGLKSRR